MDIAYIASELARAGILREALPDAMHRAHEHFSGSEPSTSEMDAWCQDLPKAAAHLFGAAPSPRSDEEEYTDLPWEIVGIPEEAWHAANPAQRRTWARQAQAEAGAPPVPPKRRPPAFTPNAAQVAELQAIPNLAQRRTAYRALRDEVQRR